MIHLLTAYKINPNAPAEWWLGNVSPDAGQMTREEKDISHLRNLSNGDREIKLRELLNAVQPMDLYNEGKVLHLYCDYYWDIEAITNFYIHDTSSYNFINYRNEIAIASAWLYHTKEWSDKVWQMMLDIPGKTKDEISFINRNHKWHSENNLGQPTFFTPDYIESFTDTVTKRYIKWRLGK